MMQDCQVPSLKMQDVGDKRKNAWLKIIKVHVISNTYQYKVYPVLVLIIWNVMKKQVNVAIYFGKNFKTFQKKIWWVRRFY